MSSKSLALCAVLGLSGGAARADILFLNEGKELRGALRSVTATGVVFESEGATTAWPLAKVLKLQFLSEKRLAGEDTVEQVAHPVLKRYLAQPPDLDRYPGAGYVTLLREQRYTLRPDGGSEKVVRVAKLIVKERGLDEANVSFGYLPPWEKGELLFGRAITGGKLFYVDDTAIKDAAENAATPAYDRARSCKFSIPNADKGGIVDYSYRVVTNKHDLEHPFAGDVFLRSDTPMLNQRLVFSVPKGVPFNYLVRNFDAASAPSFAVSTGPDGTTTYVLEVAEMPSVKPESNAAPLWRNRPQVTWAAGPGWEELGRALAAAAEAARALPPEARAAAEKAAAGATGAQAVERLHGWVAREIKYLPLGLQSYRAFPKAAAEIWSTRQGNCVDKPFFLYAALRQAGVAADLCLVQEKSSDTLLESVPSVNQFVGLAVVVPGAGGAAQWLFPYEDTLGPGELPAWAQGTRALRVTGSSGFLDVPLLPPAGEGLVVERRAALGADGSFQIEETRRPTGGLQRSYRGYKDYAKLTLDKAMEDAVSDVDTKASLASYGFENLESLTKPLSLRLAYDVRDGAIRGGDQFLVFRMPGLYFGDDRLVSDSQRENLMWFQSRSGRRVTCEMSLPAGFTVYHVPERLEVANATFSFKAGYEKTAAGLRFAYEYDRTGTEVPVDAYGAFRADLIKVRDWLDRYVVVKR